jgi:diketogulonate reductase-like aldo/keto reductase
MTILNLKEPGIRNQRKKCLTVNTFLIHSNLVLLKALNKLYLGEDRLAVQKKFVELGKFAEELGYTQSQLALAWAIVNKDVSVCLLGATKESHIVENMKSIELCKKWTPEIEERIEKILTNESPFDWRTWTPLPPRRKTQVEFAEKKE